MGFFAVAAALLIATDGVITAGVPAPGLAGPVRESGSVQSSPDLVLASSTTQTTSGTTTYAETSSRISYAGTWSYAYSSSYQGGRVKYSRQKGASATFTWTGTSVSWVGPVGPTRGQAKVYIDGQYKKTVSMYASSYVARRTVYTATYSTQRTRTLKIVVVGTSGHPIVGIDNFVVRGLTSGAAPSAGSKVVTVSSISALRTTLADNTVDTIVVANGTYRISPSSNDASNSLWIGPRYASRTRPVLVRAETIGGVTFDGGGATGFRALAFEGGAHDQTWDGFNFANMGAYQSGIIEIGGYTTRAAPHHITVRHITIESTCTGRATTANGSVWDHGVYFSQAASPGAHDILFEDMVVHGEGNLATAFHFFHGADVGGVNAHDVVVRRLTVTGTQQAFLMWEPSIYNITLDTATITKARAYAVRYETIGSSWPSGIHINNVTSTGSGYQGFYSTGGSNPPGISFLNDSLH